MTGVDINEKLEQKIGEFGLGYFDSTRKNNFLFNAVVDIIDKKVQLFQKTNKITREVQPIINRIFDLVPVNSTIDVSPTSSVVGNYYELINMTVYSPYRGSTISKPAVERRLDQIVDSFTEGTARYPRYRMASGIVIIEPSDATKVDITYFIKPVYIDVENNTDQVPYNDKLIQLIIDATIQSMGMSQRDDFFIDRSIQNEQQNP